jgi:hypothetical protein
MSQRTLNSTGNKGRFLIVDNDGKPLTSVVFNPAGLALSVILQNGTEAAITLAAAGDLLNRGKGIYEVAVPNSAYESLGDLTLCGVITDGAVVGFPQQVIAEVATESSFAKAFRWLGVLAGKASDPATLAEINATDGGATYNNVTQSQESQAITLGTVGSNVASILGKFTGITALKNWLGLLAGKGVDATALAEVQATPAGATFNNVTRSLESLGDSIASIDLSGNGQYQLTITVNDGTTPLAGVPVRIVGTQLSGSTGTLGTITFNVDGSQSYTVRVIPPIGFEPEPDAVVAVASANKSETISLAAVTYTPSAAPLCNVVIPVTDGSGTGLVGVSVKIDFLGFAPGGSPVANVLNPLGLQTSIAPGVVEINLIRFGKYKATFTHQGVLKVREFVVANAGTMTVAEPI